MSRRNRGAETATGVRPVRDRLSTSLGGAAGATAATEQAGPAEGLLAWPEPPRASSTVISGEGHGAGSADDPAYPDGGLPAGRRRSLQPLSTTLRSRTGFRAAVLVGLLAALLSGLFWWQVATGTPEAVPLGGSSAPAADQPSADGAVAATEPDPEPHPAAGPGIIIVHVAGAVANPGIVQLTPGSRLHEAIAAAGGGTAVADPDLLNLASVLEDGQKILVPALGEPAPGEHAPGEADGANGTSRSGNGPAGDRKIDLNTAGVEELGTLPRVGPVLARRIVDWRKQHGRFKSVEELDAVEGVGPKMLEALLPLVRV